MEDQIQLSLADQKELIDEKIDQYNEAKDRASRKVLSSDIRSLMSDYNERVGFLAYDENKY